MAGSLWSFEDLIQGDFTPRVIDASFSIGRPRYYDSYTGNTLTVTIRNNDGWAENLTTGSRIRVRGTAVGSWLEFYTRGITFYDGLVDGEATATVTATDIMGYLGGIPLPLDTIAGPGLTQIDILFSTYFSPGDPYWDGDTGGVYASGVLEGTVTFGDYIRQNLAGQQQSYVYQTDITLNSSSLQPFPGPTIGTAPSTTALVWDECERTGLGAEGYMGVTVSTPSGESRGGGPNKCELGEFTLQTLNSDAERNLLATGLGNSYNAQAPTFVLSIHDFPQDQTAWNSYLNNVLWSPASYVLLTYRKAGTGTATEYVVLDGTEVDISPSVTRLTVHCSSVRFQPYFVLGSAALGVLGVNRLGISWTIS
jgi:hypothetical protein